MKKSLNQNISRSEFYLSQIQKFDKEEIFKLSKNISPVYAELVKNLCISYKKNFGISENISIYVFRPPMVSIAHFYFEKLLRFQKLKNYFGSNFVIDATKFIDEIQTLEDLKNSFIEQNFNQNSICHISKIWGYATNEIDTKNSDYVSLNKKTKNHLFKIFKKRPLASYLSVAFDRYFHWIPAFNRFPVLTFSSSEEALHKYYFYIVYFKKVNTSWKFQTSSLDRNLRLSFFNKKNFNIYQLSKFLKKYNFSDEEIILIIDNFFNFLCDFFPIQFLEGFSRNLKYGEKSIAEFKEKKLLHSSASDTKSLFVMAASKLRGFKIFNFQHGGHYGYLKDVSNYLEVEFPNCDYFITWGWKILPRHNAFRNLKLVELPSAWLSERKKFWLIHFRLHENKKFDVIWMPTKIKKFSDSPQGASSPSIDIFDEYIAYIKNFINVLSSHNIKIFYKPCDFYSHLLVNSIFDSLEDRVSKFIKCGFVYEKGLSEKLLNKANLVIWDFPGTGFLECISSNIPSMILWTRFSCKEESWAMNDFEELENVGIVHRDIHSLVIEYKKFKFNPEAWINYPPRLKAQKDFSSKYALTNENWFISWKNYLRLIKVNKNYK